jgi:dephospho-CoA kinase
VLRVGLTGGIACGKSHVLARLAASGLPTIDLDHVAREVMEPGGTAYDDVVAAFGRELLDGSGAIDRKRLAAVVFADEAARLKLNALVHPRVRDVEESRVAAWAASGASVVVTDAALLVEAGLHLRFDRLVVVHCGPEEQLRRLMARDAIGEAAARARIEAQMPVLEKRRYAHFEVDTQAPLPETNVLADRLAVELNELARRPRQAPELRIEAALGCLLHGPSAGPRGLDALALLEWLAAAKGPELEALAGRLVPPPRRPWFRAARHGEAPGAAALAGPLAVWVAARRAADLQVAAAAAASVARLVHLEPERVADAVLMGVALLEALTAPADQGDASLRLSERWGGAPPSAAALVALGAARRVPGDLEAARAACCAAGGDPDLAGALVGARVGAPPEAAPGRLVAWVRRLAGHDA